MHFAKSVFFLGLAWTSSSAFGADQIIVDQTQDSLDGSCVINAEPMGQCNLRAAVAAALKNPAENILVLRVDSHVDQGAIAIRALPGSSLRIQNEGSEARTIRSTATNSIRLFDIDVGAKLSLKGLIITQFQSYNAGAIWNQGNLEVEETLFLANKASCFGTGAMTAYLTCGGGAITNFGSVTLKSGSIFEGNEVSARAGTAIFTQAMAMGGAINSSGALIFDGTVIFRNNVASAEANSGPHPGPSPVASASAFGGAIADFGGSIVIQGAGQCLFVQNEAKASASTPEAKGEAQSQGGAIYTNMAASQKAVSVCTFQNNRAEEGADFAFAPPSN